MRLASADFPPKLSFLNHSFRNIIIRVSNSMEPDQARHIFGHDPGPNCFQRLLADNTSKQVLFGKVRSK